jgi:hypothetical protein
MAASDNVTCTGKLEKVLAAQLGSQLLKLWDAVPMAFVMVQLLQWMLPRLSALVAQPTKIVVGSKRDPPSWGSQFGAAGRAEDGVVVVVVGAVVAGGLVVVGVVVEADVLEERGPFLRTPTTSRQKYKRDQAADSNGRPHECIMWQLWQSRWCIDPNCPGKLAK